jgi:hypothetical protein
VGENMAGQNHEDQYVNGNKHPFNQLVPSMNIERLSMSSLTRLFSAAHMLHSTLSRGCISVLAKLLI